MMSSSFESRICYTSRYVIVLLRSIISNCFAKIIYFKLGNYDYNFYSNLTQMWIVNVNKMVHKLHTHTHIHPPPALRVTSPSTMSSVAATKLSSKFHAKVSRKFWQESLKIFERNFRVKVSLNNFTRDV